MPRAVSRPGPVQRPRLRAARASGALALLLLTILFTARTRADTVSALGDRSGEGSTPFTGLAQAPDANLFTGALTTSIPLELPPGRRGMTPQLALQYSSAGGSTPFGVGWDMPIGRIERSTTFGVPRCTGPHTDDFVLVLPNGASRLVREAPGSNYYRPVVEQAYVRAEKFAAQNYWVVHDRSGLKYVFGNSDAARVGNSAPLTFMSPAADGTCRLTTTWALTRIEDPNGNIIDVAWSKILNVLYPATVRYGGSSRAGGPAHVYTVSFLPEWRPAQDRIVSHRTGAPARLVWRIFSIQVDTDVPAEGTLVRRYSLEYRDAAADGGAEGYQSLLSAVAVTGRPKQHLVYTASVTGHRETLTTVAKPSGAHAELRVVNDSGEVTQTVLDMNGDGLLDLVRSDDAPASAWSVYWGFVDDNGAFGFRSTAAPWQAPGNWSTLRNVVVSSGACDGNGWSCTRTDTFDITGDGIPDHVDASNPSAWVVYKGRGVPHWGFAPGVSWPAPAQYVRRSLAFTTYQDVLDVNGDGLPDLVHSAPNQPAPYQWDVYLNTGSGFEPTRQPSFPAPVRGLAVRVHDDAPQLLTDFNGDGLPDLIRAGQTFDPRCQLSEFHLASCLEVNFNRGQGFDATSVLLPVPASDTVQDANETGAGDSAVVQDLVDINGDGLPDWLRKPLGNSEWRVLLNLGGTLEALTYVPSTQWPQPYIDGIAARVWSGGRDALRSTINHNSRSDLIDVNGDGFLDQVSAGAAAWTVRLHDAHERPNLLGMMDNGLGGTSTIVYRPSTAYDNRGGDAQPDLPFITWVVDKTRQNDGQCTPPSGADVFVPGPAPARNPCIDSGNELVATYHYQDGRFDAPTREFRGFRRVIRTSVQGSVDPDNQTVTYFGQEAATNGRILQVDTLAGDAVVVRSEINLWGTRSAGAGRTQIWLAANHRVRNDLGGGQPDLVSTFSDDPDPYGNVTHFYSGSALGGPRRDTNSTFALPQAGSHVFDRPANVRVTDPNGVLEEKWFFYDGTSADGLALGAVAAGNLKRTRERLTPTNNSGPETRMTYDANGNLLTVTDANGRTTVTPYDSRALYPLGVINPFWHASTLQMDYRWGLPASIVDPNNAATLYAYDNAGRRTCVARPGDALSNCSVITTYHFAGQAGELSWVETAERQDGAHPRLTTRRYFDALGRPRYTDTFRVVDGVPTTVRSDHVVYDPAGRVRLLHHPYLASTLVPSNGSTAYDYHLNGSAFVDPLGRVSRVTHADQTTRRTEYAGALTRTYDEENQRTDTITDPFGRIVTQTVYNGAAPYVTTERAYDGLGRLRTLRQGGKLLRSITYDSLGRKTQMTDQDSGTWRYAYDAVGNLLWQDDPKPGRHVEYCYDAINRPTRRCTFANDAAGLASCSAANACTDPEAVFYRYDDNTVPFSRGRLTAVDDASGATRIEAYDQRGRQLRLTKRIELADGSREAQFAFTYDRNDRVVSTTYPDGEVVSTEYDDAGQPIALLNQSNVFYVTDALYDVFGRPTRVDHVNGVSDTRTYGTAAQRHRLTAVAASRGTVRHLDLSDFRYTPRGLLSLLIDRRNLSGDLSNSAFFAYDSLGRLTTYDSSVAALDAAFTYDVMGNLTRRGDRYLRYDNLARPHQATSLHVGSPGAPAQAMLHDANGNRTTKGAQTYAYDGSDRLARVVAGAGEAEFLYDYRGEQVAKQVTTSSGVRATRFYSALAETSGGTLTKWYFLGPLRVASAASNSLGWETAGLGRSGRPAGLGALSPLPRAVMRHAPTIAGTALLCVGVGLLLVPWRRRPVVGVAVRPGHAVLVALVFTLGLLPVPRSFPTAPAEAAVAPLVRHYHLDHLGSTQVVTDAAGEIVEQVRYLPYGGVRGHWNRTNVPIAAGDGNRREFTGYLSEALSGLQYAGARFYDPEIGSFLTQDPASQFASPYSYGGGDPVNWNDPSGEEFLVLTLIVAAAISAFASAAINSIIAAAQGLPASAVGRAAAGGAIAGAAGVGLGVVASAAAMGVSTLAGSLPAGITVTSAATALGEVAVRSAFSTTLANTAGQVAAAAGAPSEGVSALGIVVGLFASFAYDQAILDPSGQLARVEAKGTFADCSTSRMHTNITLAAAEDAGFDAAQADAILQANLARDAGWRNVLSNQDHFDLAARNAVEKFSEQALSAGSGDDALQLLGAATHHIQDQFALGHMVPGTSAFKNFWGAPVRFIIHNAVGGEVTFRQASYEATRDFLHSMRGLVGPGV